MRIDRILPGIFTDPDERYSQPEVFVSEDPYARELDFGSPYFQIPGIVGSILDNVIFPGREVNIIPQDNERWEFWGGDDDAGDDPDQTKKKHRKRKKSRKNNGNDGNEAQEGDSDGFNFGEMFSSIMPFLMMSLLFGGGLGLGGIFGRGNEETKSLGTSGDDTYIILGADGSDDNWI
jgi:hypothetical protein